MFLLKCYVLLHLYLFVYSTDNFIQHFNPTISNFNYKNYFYLKGNYPRNEHLVLQPLNSCSRWYPNSNEKSLRLNLWEIIKEINELRKGLGSWTLINNLLLPLPQWRRVEVVSLFCKNVFGLKLDVCLNKFLNGDRPKLLKLLIIDKNEALAEILFYTLDSSNSPDFDILFDIILANPKFQLQQIIDIYYKYYNIKLLDKSENEHFLDFNSELYSKEISKLGKHLIYKKHFEKNKENIKIWDILIRHVEAVNKKQFIDNEEFNQIIEKIIKFCVNFQETNNNEINKIIKEFGKIWSYVEFNSKIFVNFGAAFLRKCNKFLNEKKSNIFMKRMLIISGFVSEEEYNEELINRIIIYVKKDNFEDLISLVLIHHEKDFLKAIKNAKNFNQLKEEKSKFIELENKKEKIEEQIIKLNNSEELKEEKNKENERREELENLFKEKKLENYLIDIKLNKLEINILIKEIKKLELNKEKKKKIKNKLKEGKEKLNKLKGELEEKIKNIEKEFNEEEEAMEDLKEKQRINLRLEEEQMSKEEMYEFYKIKLENKLEEVKLRGKLKLKKKLEKIKIKLKNGENKEEQKINLLIEEKIKEDKLKNLTENELNRELRKLNLKKEEKINKKFKNELIKGIIKTKIEILKFKIYIREISKEEELNNEETIKGEIDSSGERENEQEVKKDNEREVDNETNKRKIEEENLKQVGINNYLSLDEDLINIELDLMKLESELDKVELKENLRKLKLEEEEIENNLENGLEEKLRGNKIEQAKLKESLAREENKFEIEVNRLKKKLEEKLKEESLQEEINKLEKEREEVNKELGKNSSEITNEMYKSSLKELKRGQIEVLELNQELTKKMTGILNEMRIKNATEKNTKINELVEELFKKLKEKVTVEELEEELEKLEEEKKKLEKEKNNEFNVEEVKDEETLKKELFELKSFKEKLKINEIKEEEIFYEFNLLKLKNLENEKFMKQLEGDNIFIEEINEELIKLNFIREELKNKINLIKLNKEKNEVDAEREDLKDFLKEMNKNKETLELNEIKEKYKQEIIKNELFDNFLKFYQKKFKTEMEIIELREKMRKIKLKEKMSKDLNKIKSKLEMMGGNEEYLKEKILRFKYEAGKEIKEKNAREELKDFKILKLNEFIMTKDLNKIKIEGETEEENIKNELKNKEKEMKKFQDEIKIQLENKDILEKMNKLKNKSEKTLKEQIKEKELKIILIKEKVLRNRIKLNEILKELNKIKKFINFDNDKYGLKTFFQYALSEKYNKECYGETENEAKFERELGALEYYKSANKEKNQLRDYLKTEEIAAKFGKMTCENFKNLKYNYEKKYTKDKIKNKNDYETVEKWYNLMKNRINKLELECLEEYKEKTVVGLEDKTKVEKNQNLIKTPSFLIRKLTKKERSKSIGFRKESHKKLIKSKSKLKKIKDAVGKTLTYTKTFPSYKFDNKFVEKSIDIGTLDKKQNEMTNKNTIKDILMNKSSEDIVTKTKTKILTSSATFPNFIPKTTSKKVTPINNSLHLF